MLHRVNGATLARASLPIGQFGIVALWLYMASIPGSVLRVPDAVLEVLLPFVMAILCGVGVLTLIRARRAATAGLIVGTILCAGCLVMVVAVVALMPTDLPNF